MTLIKGITVILYDKTQVGVDGFNMPIYEETATEVENVLVSPASSEDIVNNLDLTGKKVVYTLAIPKGDKHDWRNKKVEFFGETFRTFDAPIKGIDDLVPGPWNAKVKVERYE